MFPFKYASSLTIEESLLFGEFRRKFDVKFVDRAVNYKLATSYVNKLYAFFGRQPPKIVWVGNDLQKDFDYSKLVNGSTWYPRFPPSKTPAVVGRLFHHHDSHGYPKIPEIYHNVCDSLREEAYHDVFSQIVRNMIGQKAPLFSQELAYVAFMFKYIRSFSETEETIELRAEYGAILEGIWMNSFIAWFYHDTVFLVDRPRKIHVTRKNLHNEEGPAIEFRNGTGLHYINGVFIPAFIVEASPDELDGQLILKYSNVEIKRIILNKIGVDKACRDLKAKVISREIGYRLLEITYGNNITGRALEMESRSVSGVKHMEGVPTYCRTVADALEFRNSTKGRPIILT